MRKLIWMFLIGTILVSSILLVANVHASTPEFAKLVLITLGVIWLVKILVSVDQKFGKKTVKNNNH
jgi:hypothetical protein